MATQVTLSQTSGHGPALTTFNNALVLAWAGSGNNYLNVASSTDQGQTWRSPVVISSQTTDATPAIAALGSLFYLAWAGTDSNHSLNLMQSSDLKSFSGHLVFQQSLDSDTGPALVVFDDVLYVAWTNSSHELVIARVVDSGLTNEVVLQPPQTSSSSPALAADDRYIYLAWTGTNTGDPNVITIPPTWPTLNVMRSSDGESFTNKVETSEETLTKNQPALTLSGGNLILGWTGTNANNSLNTMYSTDQGLTFGGKQIDPSNGSLLGPALCSSYIAWTATDNRLNVKQGV